MSLWAGPDLKLEYAQFHLDRMHDALAPPAWNDNDILCRIHGSVVDRRQQLNLYAHFDAFLSAAHAIPGVIQCCFGHDESRKMRKWFAGLPADEQRRRNKYRSLLERHINAFAALPLSSARNTSVHRRGYPEAEARVFGRFGVTFMGTPAHPVPVSYAAVPTGPPGPMPQEIQIDLRGGDVTVGGRPILEV